MYGSCEHGIPFYDAVAMELIGYDAITLGNHDFDFGPDVLRDFILSFSNPLFLSANLDFSREPGLQELLDVGGIAKSTVVVTGGRSIGIIGATTKDLPFLAGGGDQYPFGDAPFTQLGISYQQALSNYVEQGLGGLITDTEYPEGGEGRIAIFGP